MSSCLVDADLRDGHPWALDRQLVDARLNSSSRRSARWREIVDDVDLVVVEAQEAPEGDRLGQWLLVAPGDVVEDDVPDAHRPIGRDALVGAIGLGCARAELHAHGPTADLQPRSHPALLAGPPA